MTIREWKEEMTELVSDFQFIENGMDIEKLEHLLAKAKEIAAERK